MSIKVKSLAEHMGWYRGIYTFVIPILLGIMWGNDTSASQGMVIGLIFLWLSLILEMLAVMFYERKEYYEDNK